MRQVEEVLVRPLITEKVASATEKYNRYGFEVALKANKFQIKKAVESIYDVKVLNVNTSVAAGKQKRTGMFVKKLSKTKKAYVQLAEGQKIEFFKGV